MKNTTKILAVITGVIGVVGPALVPYLDKEISAHPQFAAAIAAITGILSLFHVPTTSVAAPAAAKEQ